VGLIEKDESRNPLSYINSQRNHAEDDLLDSDRGNNAAQNVDTGRFRIFDSSAKH
jgi:hypothetical protein